MAIDNSQILLCCGGLIIILIVFMAAGANADKKRKELKTINDSKDEEIIKGFALHSKDKDVRVKAVKRLEYIEASQSAWKDLAYAKDRTIRLMAVDKLISERTLIELASDDKDKAVRSMAVDKLANDTALKQIVDFSKYEDTKIRVVEKLGEKNHIDALEYVCRMHRKNPVIYHVANEMLRKSNPGRADTPPAEMCAAGARWLIEKICYTVYLIIVLFILCLLLLSILQSFFPSLHVQEILISVFNNTK